MSHFKERLQLFKIQPFRWYLVSCFVTTMGVGLFYISMSWLVLSIRSNLNSLSVLMICAWAPSVLIGPFCGVAADRLDKKYLLMGSTLFGAVLTFLFSWLIHHHHSLFMSDAFAAMIGCFFSLYIPTMMAFIREVVPAKTLLNANATLDITYELGNMIGLGAAGIIIGLTSTHTTIFLTGILFLLGALTTLTIRHKHTKSNSDTTVKSYWHDLIDSLKYIRSVKGLTFLYVIQLLVLASFMTAPIILAPFVKNLLHANATQFGIAEGCLSLGVVLGGILSPYFAHKWGLKPVMMWESFMLIICFVVINWANSILMVQILYFFIGFAFSIWPLALTEAQRQTDMKYQGRVQAAFNSISSLIILINYLIVDFIGSLISIRHIYWFEVLMCAVIFILLGTITIQPEAT